MKHIQHSVRLSPALNRTLSTLAEQRGHTSYEMLKRVIEQGLAALTSSNSAQSDRHGTGDDFAVLSARLATIEALADRALFTASAAYCYARKSALRGDSNPDKADVELGEAALAAYRRQRALAAEALS